MNNVTTLNNKVTKAVDALEEANLNFEVGQAEIMNTVTGKISNKKKSLYRTDTGEELGVVGTNYQPVQNITAFSYFDTICELEGAQYKEIISFNGGEKVILKAEFPQPAIVGKNDEVRKQFCLVNGFNGSVGVMANFMVNRLVCSNGMRATVKDAQSSFKFKHTANVQFRMEDALQVLAKGTSYFDHFIRLSTELTQKFVDAKMVDTFLDDCFGKSESKRAEAKRDEIQGYFERGIGNEGKTAWDLYNGITEYVTHHHGKSEDTRVEYANFGGGVKLSEKAFNSAMAL
jgi:phage/plasmid-like protein (TIGR03299 family)|tara:strand:- start:8524 stop:9387 length:864 start_codon:yes stop_codon:yes gene_type:complete